MIDGRGRKGDASSGSALADADADADADVVAVADAVAEKAAAVPYRRSSNPTSMLECCPRSHGTDEHHCVQGELLEWEG